MASADQDLGVAIVGVAIFVVSGDLLGVGPWGFATLALSLFIAASPYVPNLLRFARPIAGLAAVLSILAVLLGLVAATTGGSFRLPLDQMLLLGVFFLLYVCGFFLYGPRRADAAGEPRSSAVSETPMKLTVTPLKPERWTDLDTLFSGKGCSFARSCWCMEYRLSGKRPELAPGQTRASANRLALKELVEGGGTPGLVGYRGKTPVGWVSIAPREEYRRLERSPVMKAVDDQLVWSVICFVVPSQYRGQGVAEALLKAAVAYAKKKGARIVEAYPIDKPTRSSDGFMWFGAKSMYDRAGFEEVARRKPQRPIVRLRIG